jgi:hypothetical protein
MRWRPAGATLGEESLTLLCLRMFHKYCLTLIVRVFDSLVRRGLTPHVAWRVSFVTVPFVIVVAMAFAILFLCPDTPTGSWNDRHLNKNVIEGLEVLSDSNEVEKGKDKDDQSTRKLSIPNSEDIENSTVAHVVYDQRDLEFAEAGIIQKPSIANVLKVLWSLPTLAQCALYFVTFGTELAINSNLSSFYIQSSGKPAWSQTFAANWAAMYGLLNVITRPMGGYISDCIYPIAGVEGKKFWLITCISSYGNANLFRRDYPGYCVDHYWFRTPYQCSCSHRGHRSQRHIHRGGQWRKFCSSSARAPGK